MTKAMIKMKWPAVVCMVICIGVAHANAQMTPWTDRGYVTANLGVQPQSQTFTELSTPVIYGETAQITVPHKISSGLLVDFSGRVRVWKNLGVGLGVSWFGDKDQATIAAQIPNPLFIGSPRTASANSGDLSHRETAVSIEFLWMLPLSSKISVAAVAGPSFVHVKQDLVNSITAVESGAPFATVTIGSVAIDSASAWAKGVNAGVDGIYKITDTVGAGAFVRFIGGSADLTTGSGNTVSIDAGGFQLGAGLRYRFNF
jgi:opacity protein-like surface antigen